MKEFFISYIRKNDKLNSVISKQLFAVNARDALATFKENVSYREIKKVVEWVNNRIQVEHTLKDEEIETT